MCNYRFEQDCKIFEELINEGRSIAKNSRSIRGHGNYVSDAEQRAYTWFIKSRNFLVGLLGENFRDLNSFNKCFVQYTQRSLLTEEYRGTVAFVREDIEKGIGVLEGIFSSFKNKRIKRQSIIKISIMDLYHEIKDWGKIAAGLKKKPSN